MREKNDIWFIVVMVGILETMTKRNPRHSLKALMRVIVSSKLRLGHSVFDVKKTTYKIH